MYYIGSCPMLYLVYCLLCVAIQPLSRYQLVEDTSESSPIHFYFSHQQSKDIAYNIENFERNDTRRTRKVMIRSKIEGQKARTVIVYSRRWLVLVLSTCFGDATAYP